MSILVGSENMPGLCGTSWIKNDPGPVILCTILNIRTRNKQKRGPCPVNLKLCVLMATALVKHNNYDKLYFKLSGAVVSNPGRKPRKTL